MTCCRILRREIEKSKNCDLYALTIIEEKHTCFPAANQRRDIEREPYLGLWPITEEHTVTNQPTREEIMKSHAGETHAKSFSQSEIRERQKVHALANRRTEIILLRHQESKSHMSHACCIANQRREGHMMDVAANQKIENVHPDTTMRYNAARGVQSLYFCYLTCILKF